MKEFIKITVFVEFIAMLVIVITHLVIHINGMWKPEHVKVCWIVPTIVFAAMLLVKFILEPIANWWLE
jgi:hypothetical protein